MSTGRDSDYLLGTSDVELHRLGYQHQVWFEHAEDAWNQAGFKKGDRLLDLGSGPGFASLDLASRVGRSGKVVAVDSSEKYLRHLEKIAQDRGCTQIETIRCDIESEFPVLDIFDGVYIRWLLCFLKNPQRIVEQVANVLVPGGSVCIQDYFNYKSIRLFPAHPIQDVLFDAFDRSSRAHGGNYNIGSALPGMLTEAGLIVTRLKPVCHTAQPGSPVWKWFRLFTASYVPSLVQENFLSLAQAQEVEERLDYLESDPGAFFFSPPVILINARKPDLPSR